MAKTNKQLQAEIDRLTIKTNNLVDMLEIAEKGIRGVSKLIGLDGIAEATYFDDADIGAIEIAIKQILEKNKDQDESIKELDELCGKRRSDYFKLEEKLDKCKEEKEYKILKIKNKGETYFVSETCYEETLEALQKEIAELTIQKHTLRKENKRLKKRRRSGRYEPKKVYEKLARGRLCYIPEGDYLPTKVHESLIDATEEAHRLQHITGHTVYVMGTYCKI